VRSVPAGLEDVHSLLGNVASSKGTTPEVLGGLELRTLALHGELGLVRVPKPLGPQITI